MKDYLGTYKTAHQSPIRRSGTSRNISACDNYALKIKGAFEIFFLLSRSSSDNYALKNKRPLEIFFKLDCVTPKSEGKHFWNKK
jgi:hypothetical protein